MICNYKIRQLSFFIPGNLVLNCTYDITILKTTIKYLLMGILLYAEFIVYESRVGMGMIVFIYQNNRTILLTHLCIYQE